MQVLTESQIIEIHRLVNTNKEKITDCGEFISIYGKKKNTYKSSEIVELILEILYPDITALKLRELDRLLNEHYHNYNMFIYLSILYKYIDELKKRK